MNSAHHFALCQRASVGQVGGRGRPRHLERGGHTATTLAIGQVLVTGGD